MNSSLLLSALGEPKQTFDGQDLYEDILLKAAALMRSLIQNHCFHDGNKRTAMMATIIFLEENGYEVAAPNNKMYRLAMKIVREKPTPTANNIARTLNKYTKPYSYKQKSRFIIYKDRILNWIKSV
ncbi:MAG: type II toxin-antitoxin system death-on-curing family toxin [Eubacteriales bacterium]|jgi:prophage maintenance system killer protein